MKLLRDCLFILVLALLIATFCNAEEFSGVVIKVFDGDTIRVVPDTFVTGVKVYKDGSVSVRLRGIDAPEKAQPYGMEAKEYLKGLVLRKKVRVQVIDIDRYGRIDGYVYVGSLNVNLEMVKSGYAWAYEKYLDRPYASEFYSAERDARMARKGLWHQSNPLPPWEYRKLKRRGII